MGPFATLDVLEKKMFLAFHGNYTKFPGLQARSIPTIPNTISPLCAKITTA
jgi:hypothetical protein